MLPNINKLLLFITISAMVCSCGSNRFEVDTDKVEIPAIKVQNLAKDVATINEKNISEKTIELKNKYGKFYERYIVSFICDGGISDSLYPSQLLQFLNDKDMSAAFQYINKQYPESELNKINNELLNGIKRFHYFFPKKQLPKYLTACMSGFNYAVAFTDSTLGYSLDMYLGEKAPFYSMLNWPQYKTRIMNKQHLPSDIMRGWLLNEFDNTDANNTLLFHTIFYGKLYFATKQLMPHVHDSVIIGYNTKQMAYCKAYEKNLWGYMAEKNRLYENNMRHIQELTGEGPFTSAISKECPPGIAKWIGWQIVKNYMEKNEDVTLEQLMNEKDAQKILNKSKYRP